MSGDFSLQTCLVLGGSGLLGQAVTHTLENQHRNNMLVIAPSRSELDISDLDALGQFLSETSPNLIVNCAGWTDVDLAESLPEKVYQSNVSAVKVLADFVLSRRRRLFQISTAFVFSGSPGQYFGANDAANPVNVYGVSKQKAEQICLDTVVMGGDVEVFRTFWLYGPGKGNFVDFVVQRVLQGMRMTIVSDQSGQPTLTTDVARAISARVSAKNPIRMHHAVNTGVATRIDIASFIIDYFGADPGLIIPITAKAFRAPAKRPTACNLVENQGHGYKFRSWQAALEEYLAKCWPKGGTAIGG